MGFEPNSEPAVSLFIPTWNAGPEFPEILHYMMEQELDRPFDILAIDSGSRDGTVEFLRSEPVQLTEIPNHEFNHGLTRNRGIQQARGAIVALATQDARPANLEWLQRLVDCFEDPKVAGAFSRQHARPDASPIIKDRLGSWVAGNDEPQVQEVGSDAEFLALEPLERYRRVAFDNVSSAVRKSVMDDFPFQARKFGEDIDWARRIVLAGHRIVFEPRSQVIHSHNNSPWYEFKRIYGDHGNLYDLLGVHTIPRLEDVLPCVWNRAEHYLKAVERDRSLGVFEKAAWALRVIAYSLAENVGQFLGARSVGKLRQGNLFYRAIDGVLRKGV